MAKIIIDKIDKIIVRTLTELVCEYLSSHITHKKYIFSASFFLLSLTVSAYSPLLAISNRSEPKIKEEQTMAKNSSEKTSPRNHFSVTLFLCGDVMTGRGIDQILPNPSDPTLYEPYVKDARLYVKLAEDKNGPIPKPVDFTYIWGDALEKLKTLKPDLKIINLETSITKSDHYWKGKWIHYRMNPDNIGVLTSAGIDFASLANNHVLDWGYEGLTETLRTLQKAEIKTAGAGKGILEASAPAVFDLGEKGKVTIFSYGSTDSGIFPEWEARKGKMGINIISDFSDETTKQIVEKIKKINEEKNSNIIIVSIHWGGNWGYYIEQEHRQFAHRLIDEAGVNIIHGHSSHHPKGIEIYKGKLIIYGAGDFINDYEGIGGHESFRADLRLMYFATLDSSSGILKNLTIVPMRTKRFRLHKVREYADLEWIKNTLNREGKKLGTRFVVDKHQHLRLVD